MLRQSPYRPPVACPPHSTACAAAVAIPRRCQSGGPAELVDQRTEVERDIGDPTAGYDVGAVLQRLDDSLRAGVDRGVRQPIAYGLQLLAGVKIAEVDAGSHQPINVAANVVAGDDGDADVVESELLAELGDPLAARARLAPPAFVTIGTPLSRQVRSAPQSRSSIHGSSRTTGRAASAWRGSTW